MLRAAGRSFRPKFRTQSHHGTRKIGDYAPAILSNAARSEKSQSFARFFDKDTSISPSASIFLAETREEPIASTSKIPISDATSASSALSQEDKRILRYTRRLQRKLRSSVQANEKREQLNQRLLQSIEDLYTRIQATSRLHSSVTKRLSALFHDLQGLICQIRERNSPQSQLEYQAMQLRLVMQQAMHTSWMGLDANNLERRTEELQTALQAHRSLASKDSGKIVIQRMKQFGFRFLPYLVDTDVLEGITTASLASNGLLSNIGQEVLSEHGWYNTGACIHSLQQFHESLFLKAERSHKSAKSRMYGPAAGHRDLHAGVRYLLSSWAVSKAVPHSLAAPSEKAERRKSQQKQLENVVALLSHLKHERLPPDRQIIASVLVVAQCLGRKSSSEALRPYLPMLWQEWTLLRENDIDEEADRLILLGFLHNVPSHKHETWHQQAVDMAVDTAEVRPVREGFVPPQLSLQAPIESGRAKMVKSIALAATRLGDIKRALNCVFDGCLSVEATLQVLWALSRHADSLSRQAMSMASPLLQIVSDVAASLVPSLASAATAGHPLPPKVAEAVLGIATALIHHQHPKVAKTLLSSISQPKVVPLPLLQTLFQELVGHGHARTALDWYTLLDDRQQVDPVVVSALLQSSNIKLSDQVWLAVQAEHTIVPNSLLRARLQHHVGNKAARYQQALQEYRKHTSGKAADTSLLVDLLSLHAAASKPSATAETYEKIMSRRDRPADLLNTVLSIAHLPRRRAWRLAGPSSSLSRTMSQLDRLVQVDQHQPNTRTANYLLLSHLKWRAHTNEEIWAVLSSALERSSLWDWDKELKPLYQMITKAFRLRGETEEAKKVVVMMAKERDRRRRAKFSTK